MMTAGKAPSGFISGWRRASRRRYFDGRSRLYREDTVSRVESRALSSIKWIGIYQHVKGFRAMDLGSDG